MGLAMADLKSQLFASARNSFAEMLL